LKITQKNSRHRYKTSFKGLFFSKNLKSFNHLIQERTNYNAKIRCLFIVKTKGIIATVTNFILKVEGNITYLDQHVDIERNVFLCD
jgi:hypothetical protein